MTTLLDHFARVVDDFGRHLGTVAPEQWTQPTPCVEWDVRQLVAHVVDEQLWVPALLAGESVAEVGDRFAGDQLRDAPDAAWRAAASGALAAASAEDALQRRVHLSYGDEAADTYLWQITADTLIHTWDLARATGSDEALDREATAAVAEFLAPQVEGWRAAGAFAAAVAVPADADPQTRLLALTGRST